MGFFSALYGCQSHKSSYQTNAFYEKNRAMQIAMTPKTIAQLRLNGVTEQTRLKLEYFFYTNTKEKASALYNELKVLGYEGKYEPSANNDKVFVITGWTPKIQMDEQTVVEWTAKMCDLGQSNDCEFDGWGTNPHQD